MNRGRARSIMQNIYRKLAELKYTKYVTMRVLSDRRAGCCVEEGAAGDFAGYGFGFSYPRTQSLSGKRSQKSLFRFSFTGARWRARVLSQFGTLTV